MISVRPARHLACRTHLQAQAAALLFPQPLWMLSTMLFKVRKQLESSLQVWGSVYSCWFGVSLQVSNCIASGIVPKSFFAGGILVFTHHLMCFLQLFPCLHTEDRERRRERERERERERGRGKRGERERAEWERETAREREREGKRESQRGRASCWHQLCKAWAPFRSGLPCRRLPKRTFAADSIHPHGLTNRVRDPHIWWSYPPCNKHGCGSNLLQPPELSH